MPPPTALRRFAVAAVVSAAVVGCTKNDRVPTFPVRGKVTYNGKPLGKASLIFVPNDPAAVKNMQPTATTAADGTFKASTYLYADGAPAGGYKVTVHLERTRKAAGGDEEGTGQSAVPAKYTDAATTPLTATVVAPETDVGTLALVP
jgi:hypothetical protein